MNCLQKFLVISVAYILAHGLTAWLITPLQSRMMPEITAYASLLYLPHGVRVLSTWLMGARAFPPLCLGAFLAELMFTPPEVSHATDPVILLSIAVGAASALLAFEVMRACGYRLYAGQNVRIHWKWLLLVGVLASVINSVGQAMVFSGSFLPGMPIGVLVTYAVGDLAGLIATTLVLMLVFRWMRAVPSRA